MREAGSNADLGTLTIEIQLHRDLRSWTISLGRSISPEDESFFRERGHRIHEGFNPVIPWREALGMGCRAGRFCPFLAQDRPWRSSESIPKPQDRPESSLESIQAIKTHSITTACTTQERSFPEWQTKLTEESGIPMASH